MNDKGEFDQYVPENPPTAKDLRRARFQELEAKFKETGSQSLSSMENCQVVSILILDALEEGRLEAPMAIDFAWTLQQYPNVPMIIGNDEIGIADIQSIVRTRIDLIKNAISDPTAYQNMTNNRQACENVAEILGEATFTIQEKYFGFRFPPEDLVVEVKSLAQSRQATKDLLNQPSVLYMIPEDHDKFFDNTLSVFLSGALLDAKIRNEYELPNIPIS